MKNIFTLAILPLFSLLAACTDPASSKPEEEFSQQNQSESPGKQAPDGEAGNSGKAKSQDSNENNKAPGSTKDYEAGHDSQYSSDPSYKARYDNARKEYRRTEEKLAEQLFPRDLDKRRQAVQCFENKAKRTFYCTDHLGRTYRGDCEKLQQGC